MGLAGWVIMEYRLHQPMEPWWPAVKHGVGCICRQQHPISGPRDKLIDHKHLPTQSDA